MGMRIPGRRHRAKSGQDPAQPRRTRRGSRSHVAGVDRLLQRAASVDEHRLFACACRRSEADAGSSATEHHRHADHLSRDAPLVEGSVSTRPFEAWQSSWSRGALPRIER